MNTIKHFFAQLLEVFLEAKDSYQKRRGHFPVGS
jgi:hypothetical protein